MYTNYNHIQLHRNYTISITSSLKKLSQQNNLLLLQAVVHDLDVFIWCYFIDSPTKKHYICDCRTTSKTFHSPNMIFKDVTFTLSFTYAHGSVISSERSHLKKKG